MRIRLTVPGKHVDADTLDAALEASTRIAQKEVAAGDVPSIHDAIGSGRVRWRPEPSSQGFEGFDLPSTVIKRGWGDCDDLAAWLAAELREEGEDPDAQAIVYQSGKDRWHAVVQRGNGDIQDPSRWAGMGRPGGPLPVTSPIETNISTVGFRALGDGARCRFDVPLVGEGWAHELRAGDVGLCIERTGRNQWEALGRAANGAFHVLLEWGAPDEVLAKLYAMHALMRGDHLDDIEGVIGCEISELGELVGAIADRVGATMTMRPAGNAADIAATILDPLGIRNIVAPLAHDFVSNYASSLAQRGSSSKDDDKIKTTGDVGARGATRGSSRGGSRGSSSRGSSSSRGGRQQQQQQPDDPYGDYGDAWGGGYGDWGNAQPWFAPQAPQMPYPMQPQMPFAMPPQMPNYYGGGYPPAQYFDPSGAYSAMNPYGPTLPGTDLAPDAYGGYATPTAFSKYAQQWKDEQKHSAFDGQILLGQTFTEGDASVHHYAPISEGAFADLLEDLKGVGVSCELTSPFRAKCTKGGAKFIIVRDDDQTRVQALSNADDVWKLVESHGVHGDDDPCPRGWHWENRGGINVCVPDR